MELIDVYRLITAVIQLTPAALDTGCAAAQHVRPVR